MIEEIRWIKFGSNRDERGCLTAVECRPDLGIEVKRIFYMHDVTPGADRGGHAHRETDQVAIGISGELRILVSDGLRSMVVPLRSKEWGIYLPRMTWTRLYDFSPGAVCLVLANTNYDRSKSLRTWNDFTIAAGFSCSTEPSSTDDLCIFGQPSQSTG